MNRARIVLVVAWLTGCAGIIGVPDLTLQELPDADASVGEAGKAGDGHVATDGSGALPTDANQGDALTDGGGPDVDAATCDLAAVESDPLNCGACGHVCLDDGGCAEGLCKAVPLATIDEGYIGDIIEHGNYLYATANYFSAAEDVVGVWRIDKLSGAKVLFAPLHAALRAAIVGDTLWIAASNYGYDPDSPELSNGGLYRCALTATPPCTPQIVLPFDQIASLQAIEGSKLQFMSSGAHVTAIFDTTAVGAVRDDAGADAAVTAIWDAYPSGSVVDQWASTPNSYGLAQSSESVAVYAQKNGAATGTKVASWGSDSMPGPRRGRITGNASSVYFSAQEFFPGLNGTVQRIDRGSDKSCILGDPDAGAAQTVRPMGVYVDSRRVFWANQGDSKGAGASIAYCDVDTCCTDARFLWHGTTSPAAITGDTGHIYFSTDQETTNSIYRTTKP